MSVALITGITGQDGSYLADLLLEKGYTVHGAVRRTSAIERSRLRHLYDDPEIYGKRLHLHYADLDDMTTMRRLLNRLQPSEIYHLAGQSHVGLSFDIPESTCELTAMGTLRLLELVRDLPYPVRLLHTSSSEIFGRPRVSPQDEETPMAPVTPYGVAKAFATQMVRVYRESMGLFAINAICYNHESPRRGENFVTRKIARAAAEIAAGRRHELALGDLSGERDWGDARDYVRGMWQALNHEKPEDFVFATGKLHSVKDILDIAFHTVGLDWTQVVRTDDQHRRAGEPFNLVGNPAKAQSVLGWKRQNDFEQLIREMTKEEVAAMGG